MMKYLRMLAFRSCFVMTLCFLTVSFPVLAPAEATDEERIKNCGSCCDIKKQVCVNLNPDLRLCEAVFQTCVAACEAKGDSPSEGSDCWTQSQKQTAN